MSSIELNDVSTYKDSGVPWLGIIPVGWSVIRLKDVGKSIIGLTYAPEDVLDDDAGKLVLRSSNIQQGELSLLDNVYVAKKIPRNLTLRTGDILICSRNGSRNLIGKNITIDERTVGQTFGAFMTVYRSKYSNFLRYFFNSRIFESQSGLYMSSTINQLTINTLNNFSFVLPTANEQTAIATYLDIKTTQIDRQINLLGQKAAQYSKLKQSLINETVTRGLNKSVPMKDSGVEWIGKMPVHWDVKRLKDLFTERSQKGCPDEPLLIASQTLGVTLKSLYSRNTMTVQDDFHLMKLVNINDFVISLRSFEGGIEMATHRGIISAAYTILSSQDSVDARFYKHLFKSTIFISLLVTCTTGIREGRNVNYQQLKRELLALPPLQEQTAIATYLDEKTVQIDRIVISINDQIDKLKDLRKALINDVVTGKIKVVSEGQAV